MNIGRQKVASSAREHSTPKNRQTRSVSNTISGKTAPYCILRRPQVGFPLQSCVKNNTANPRVPIPSAVLSRPNLSQLFSDAVLTESSLPTFFSQTPQYGKPNCCRLQQYVAQNRATWGAGGDRRSRKNQFSASGHHLSRYSSRIAATDNGMSSGNSSYPSSATCTALQRKYLACRYPSKIHNRSGPIAGPRLRAGSLRQKRRRRSAAQMGIAGFNEMLQYRAILPFERHHEGEDSLKESAPLLVLRPDAFFGSSAPLRL